MKRLINILIKTGMYGVLLLAFMALPLHVYAQGRSLNEVVEEARARGIGQAQLQELQSRAQKNSITDEQLVEIIQPAVTLAREDLPSEAVLQKAMEGLSKGVSGNRLIPVLQHMQRATHQAAAVVDPWIRQAPVREMLSKSRGFSKAGFRREMIKAVSRGMMKNMKAEFYSKALGEVGKKAVFSKTNAPGVIAAVGVMSELGANDKQPDLVKNLVIRSLKSGFKASELQKLPTAMRMAQQRSELPAASVIEGVSRQLNAGIPANRILQNLFNGNIGGGPPGGTPPGLENKGNHGKGNKGHGNGH